MTNLWVCGDPELQDEYLAVLMRLRGDKMDNATTRIFMILRVLCYPIQHAIMHESLPTENPAPAQGIICRMHMIRPAMPEDISRFDDYEASRVGCIVERMSRTTDIAQRHILARHLGGIYQHERGLLTYKIWEVQEASS